MSYSSRNSYSRYNRYSGRNGQMSNFERTLRRRRKIAAGVVTIVGLAAIISIVWFIATLVNVKNQVGTPGQNGGSGTPIPSQSATNNTPIPEGPTNTPSPVPTLTFAQQLAEEVKSHDKKPIILIDPGHGFNSEGVMKDGTKGIHTGAYVNNTWEDNINLDIALKLRDLLLATGCEVMMTREGDDCTQAGPGNSADLIARRDMANNSNADAFISIHQNTAGDTSINGTQVWCNSRWNEFSDELGNIMLQYVTEATGAKAIKVYDESYKPANDGLAIPKANKPTALIECGYMTNPDEFQKLISPDYQQKIAEGIVAGLFEFFRTVTIWK